MRLIYSVLSMLLSLYEVVLFIYVVLSWIHPAANKWTELVRSLVEPVLAPIRRLLRQHLPASTQQSCVIDRRAAARHGKRLIEPLSSDAVSQRIGQKRLAAGDKVCDRVYMVQVHRTKIYNIHCCLLILRAQYMLRAQVLMPNHG